jgi:carboxyl-terminal processing protease
MKTPLLSSLLAASMLAALPAYAAPAPAKQDPLADMDEFIAVYKKVKASYVDKVDDKQLMEGAISRQERFPKPANTD